MSGSGIAALVLAGTRAGGDPLAVHAGVSHKALIDVGGRPMLARVLAALDAAPGVGRIIVAIERADVLASMPAITKPVVTLPAAGGPSASVARAIEQHGVPLLVTTADHALLRSEWVEDFLAATREAPMAVADALVAFARRDSVLAAAPDTERTWLSLADDAYSGCNLFLLRNAASLGLVRLWQQLEAERKRPLSLLRRLGLLHVLRYRLGRLTLRQALDRLGQLGAARVAPVILADGRAAIDVDKPADLELVRKLLGPAA